MASRSAGIGPGARQREKSGSEGGQGRGRRCSEGHEHKRRALPVEAGGMKAQPNRYSISVAPTGRARCRACKGLVARGGLRIVTLAVVCERPRRVTKFVRHADCVDAAFARLVLRAHGKVENVLAVGAVDVETVCGVREKLQALV
jgi:hypothetical protein